VIYLDVRKLLGRVRGVIHGGAHWGEEMPLYRKMGARSILFFEPNPDAFRRLDRRVRRYATAEPYALGSKPGRLTLNLEVTNGGTSSSLLPPNLHGKYWPNAIRFAGSVDVDVVTLDDYFAEHGGAAEYDTLVLDLQGYELEALKGARKTLAGLSSLVVEINREELYKGGAMVDDVDRFLASHGFKRTATNWLWGPAGDALYQR
jgi:FkbM family methyltransferase